MSKATIELDFLGLEKKQTNNAPKPKFKKFLDRRRSFRGSFTFFFFFSLSLPSLFFSFSPLSGFLNFIWDFILFAEIQGAISKIDPEIIKSLLASGANSSARSLSVPTTPREDQPQIPISPVHAPLPRYFFSRHSF